ncbi:MAG: hypothetical protein P4L46_00975 [Fimbriimonas sp.]|nr:hypothetical protein [Fimbriimonas sp.]
MLLTLAALALYSFPAGSKTTYDVNVSFDGYLPILGGRVGRAEVEMAVEAVGLTPSPEGNPRATNEIKTLQLTYNGAVMPFGVANVREFYPKATIEFTSHGKLVKTDVPDRQVPFRLPGLDSKRLQDITFLPIEFPAGEIETNHTFRFKKDFGGSPVEYDVTPTKIEGDRTELAIKLTQEYTDFEDASHNSSDESAAQSKVVTKLSGEGSATFDMKRGLVESLAVSAAAVSEVTDLKSQATTERKLKTKLKVSLSPTTHR